MVLDGKPFESIDRNDLQALVENQVSEGKGIDFKSKLPGGSDSEKKDFLADVSSFANTIGGYLLYGVEEQKGVASRICGVKVTDPDAEISRLENMIRDGIEPRIPGVSIRSIPLETPEIVIIIKIPRSWALPHMVTFRGHGRFYARNSAGKYPLDVHELRSLFSLSETVAERIRNFRAERLFRIVSGETPVALDGDVGTIILHIVPMSSFHAGYQLGVSELSETASRYVSPHWGGRNRYNFDGFLRFRMWDSHIAAAYVQIFRNGCIEAVDAHMLRPWDERRVIPSLQFEKELIESLQQFLALQKQLGVEPPLVVMLSLVGVAGYTMGVQSWWPIDRPLIDRDSLVVPEVLVEDHEVEPQRVMKPIFDAVWNAAGWPRSPYYDDQGNWIGEKAVR
ncbi:MAG: ATP-binding protein, partial [Anaerolineae bacterium]|nr:ATP-binding protein [Anaerolineae bacterium]